MAKRLSPYRPQGVSFAGHVRDKIEALCTKLDYVPITELITCARDPDATIADKIAVAKTISEYIYPKMKSFDPDEAKKAQGLNIVVMKYSEVGDALKQANEMKVIELDESK